MTDSLLGFDLTDLSAPDCEQKLERERLSPSELAGICRNPSFIAASTAYVRQAAEYRSLRDRQSALFESVPDPVERRTLRAAFACKKDCPVLIVPQRRVPSLNALSDSGPTESTIVCGGMNIRHGDPPYFQTWNREAPDPNQCCARLNVSAADRSIQPSEQIRPALVAGMLRSRIEDRIASDQNLSLSIQRFNGLGCIGCTERVNNECLQNIDARRQPIYGARAADLMINSVMASEGVRRVMRDLLSEFNVPVRSSLCRLKGPGRHSINREQYLAEQRSILGPRPACRSLFTGR